MGKRKFILTASVIFVIGFGYCLYSTAKNKISEELPMEELIRHSGTESIVTEHHYFTSDPDEFPYEEVRNLPEEEFVKHEGAEEDYTEGHFYIPDEEMVNLPEEEFVKHEGAEEDYTGVRFIYIPD